MLSQVPEVERPSLDNQQHHDNGYFLDLQHNYS